MSLPKRYGFKIRENVKAADWFKSSKLYWDGFFRNQKDTIKSVWNILNSFFEDAVLVVLGFISFVVGILSVIFYLLKFLFEPIRSLFFAIRFRFFTTKQWKEEMLKDHYFDKYNRGMK